MAGLFELTAVAAVLPSALPPSKVATFPVWDDGFGYVWWLDRAHSALYVARTCADDGEDFDRAAVVPLAAPAGRSATIRGPDFLVPTTLDFNSRQEEDESPIYYTTLSGKRLDHHSRDSPIAVQHRESRRSSRHVLLLASPGERGPSSPHDTPDHQYALVVLPQGVPWVTDNGTVPTSADAASLTTNVVGASAQRLAAVEQLLLGPNNRGPLAAGGRSEFQHSRPPSGAPPFTVSAHLLAEVMAQSTSPSTTAWSPGGHVLYFVTRRSPTAITAVTTNRAQSPLVTRLNTATATVFWSVPQSWLATGAEPTVPDLPPIVSVSVDSKGQVWAALGPLGVVVRLSPSVDASSTHLEGARATTTAPGLSARKAARVTGVVRLPSKGVITGCCFGGPNLGILYITALLGTGESAGQGYRGVLGRPEHQLFTANVSSFTSGLPAPRFELGDLSAVPEEAAVLLRPFGPSNTPSKL